VVEEKIVYEFKVSSSLTKKHEAQLLTYLYLCNITHGKLANFRTRLVQHRYVNTSLDSIERTRFELDDKKYVGPAEIPSTIRDLVADWGTGLDASHYRRALCSTIGTETEQEHLLPMNSHGTRVGNQRFYLLLKDTGIGVTTYRYPKHDNRRDFERLVRLSPLKRLHWVNITHRCVTIETIANPLIRARQPNETMESKINAALEATIHPQ